jgi:hypothetical protein
MASQPSEDVYYDTPVAPMRDFMKVANSIGRNAVPGGLFTGKSKQLYDCLYALTRGAITPSRSVRISRPKLMKKAHIGSRVTFDANISRLLSVGLITVKQIPGEHEGNEYTVYLPEESQTAMATPTSQSSQTSWSGYAQNLGSPDSLENSHTSHTLNDDIGGTSGHPKTFVKTLNTNDDEIFSMLTKALKSAALKITGTESVVTEAEKDRWGEVGDILSAELQLAASRATVISSLPAFFAEHLRRRFSKRANENGDPASRAIESGPRYTSDPAPNAPTHLNDAQLTESAEMLAEFMARGEYTVEAITEQFSAGFSKGDWVTVMEKAIEIRRQREQA